MAPEARCSLATPSEWQWTDGKAPTAKPPTSPWVVSTLAGTGTEGFLDSAGSSAQFNYPRGVVVDSAGIVYVADYNSHRIRKIEYKP